MQTRLATILRAFLVADGFSIKGKQLTVGQTHPISSEMYDGLERERYIREPTEEELARYHAAGPGGDGPAATTGDAGSADAGTSAAEASARAAGAASGGAAGNDADRDGLPDGYELPWPQLQKRVKAETGKQPRNKAEAIALVKEFLARPPAAAAG